VPRYGPRAFFVLPSLMRSKGAACASFNRCATAVAGRSTHADSQPRSASPELESRRMNALDEPSWVRSKELGPEQRSG
jgi:hypothetical protein